MNLSIYIHPMVAAQMPPERYAEFVEHLKANRVRAQRLMREDAEAKRLRAALGPEAEP